jgi:hypothetical protein
VRTILCTVKPITTRTVINALKQYKDENIKFSFSGAGKITARISNMKMVGNTLKPEKSQGKAKCTLTRCQILFPTTQKCQSSKRMV